MRNLNNSEQSDVENVQNIEKVVRKILELIKCFSLARNTAAKNNTMKNIFVSYTTDVEYNYGLFGSGL